MSLTSLVGPFGSGLITALGHTFSVRVIGQQRQDRARETNGQVIYAFWHEGLAIATYVFRDQGIRVLVSQHRDGEYISRTIEHMGYTTIRGSTTRGGAKALFQMAAAGARGEDLGITVDGPRGPRHQVQSGVLAIARRSGLPILPFAVACTRKKVLSSWDRFIVPMPFASVAVAFGESMTVPKDCMESDMDRLKVILEKRLLLAGEEAESTLDP